MAYHKEGKYYAEIIEHGIGEAKSGNQQLVFRLNLLAWVNPETNRDEEYTAKFPQTMFITMTDKMVDRALEFLSSVGFTGGTFSSLDPKSRTPVSLAGQKCYIENVHWNDKDNWQLPYNSTDNKASENKPLASNQDAARKLDQLYGAKLKQNAAKAKAKQPAPPPQQETVPPTADDDEVPF